MPFSIEATNDFPAIEAIWNRNSLVLRVDAEEMAYSADKLEPQFQSTYWIGALDGEGVGVAVAEREIGSYHPQRWFIRILVDEAHRGKGFGAELYKAARVHTDSTNPISIVTKVHSDDESSLGFARHLGYSERFQEFESVLHLDKVNEELLGRFANRDLPAGVEIHSLSDIDSDSFRKDAHELFEEVRFDTPRLYPPTRLGYDMFVNYVVADPFLNKEASVFAMLDGHPIAFSTCFEGMEEGGLHQGLTAVQRNHRGKGLAGALKARVILYGQERGYRSLRTDNNTMNWPILSINEGLGFERLAAISTLEWNPTNLESRVP